MGNFHNFRIWYCIAAFILVYSGSGFLTITSLFIQDLTNTEIRRVIGFVFPFIIKLEKYILTGQVSNGMGTHSHAPIACKLINTFWRNSLQHHQFCFTDVGKEHTVAYKTEADTY